MAVDVHGCSRWAVDVWWWNSNRWPYTGRYSKWVSIRSIHKWIVLIFACVRWGSFLVWAHDGESVWWALIEYRLEQSWYPKWKRPVVYEEVKYAGCLLMICLVMMRWVEWTLTATRCLRGRPFLTVMIVTSWRDSTKGSWNVLLCLLVMGRLATSNGSPITMKLQANLL